MKHWLSDLPGGNESINEYPTLTSKSQEGQHKFFKKEKKSLSWHDEPRWDFCISKSEVGE